MRTNKRKKRKYAPRTRIVAWCKVCKSLFQTTRMDTQFCRQRCKQHAYRARVRERKARERERKQKQRSQRRERTKQR